MPVWFVVPTCVTVPVIFVLARVARPLTFKLFVTFTSLLGTRTLPVPLARSSRSAFDTFVSITLS